MSDRIHETLKYLQLPERKKKFYLEELEEQGINDNFIVRKLEPPQNGELQSILQNILPVELTTSFLETFQRMELQAVDLKNCKVIYGANDNNNGENNTTSPPPSSLPSTSSSVSQPQHQNIPHDSSLVESQHGQKRPRLSPPTESTTTATIITNTLPPHLHEYSKWTTLTGPINPENIIQPSHFVQIQPILNPPSISLLPGNQQQISSPIFPRLTAYLLQHIKMWGPQVISASQLYSQFYKTSRSSATARKRTSQGRASSSINVTMSRIDFVNYLTSALHPIVMQDVFRILSLFPVALPLVIPTMKNDADDDDSKFKILIPLLRNCTVRWTKNSQTVENCLFSSPFKMIGVLRIGSGKNVSVAGKSSFLNELLKDKYIFSSTQEPGSFAPPLSLMGTIEFIPLTEETCSNSFWELINSEPNEDEGGRQKKMSNEIFLLANLHGDANDSRLEDQVKYLHSICSAFVLFLMPDSDDDDGDNVNSNDKDSREERDEKIKAKLKRYENEIKNNNYNNSKIPKKKNKKQLTKIFKLYVDPDDELIERYEDISIFSTQLSQDANIEVVREVFKRAIGTPSKKMNLNNILNCGKLRRVEEIGTEESRILTSKIQSLSSEEVNELLSLQNETDHTEARRLVHSTYTMKDLMPESRSRRTNRDQILYHFLQILNQSSTDRQISMEHLDSFLSRLSSSSSSSNSGHQFKITMVHLFRELMTIHEHLMRSSLSESDPPFVNEHLSDVPEKVAELLLQGQCIELYNADKGIERMSRSWLDNVLHNICHHHPNLRVFVVSILGIQSTGKSTLLNALFGCKFAVSAGSCTHGLFMRLLFLEEKYAEKQGFDAVLIIDTEGLCSPEKANDARAAEHDRKMSCFAVAISNLTLININGEASLPILNILQIVIVTLGRLRKVGLEPSDLMVLQHSMEKNESRHSAADTAFRQNLEDAIKSVREYPIKYNLSRDYKKVMENWEKSINSPDLKMEFAAFKGGSGKVGAPPSEAYHKDVKRLHTKIMERGKNGNQYEFHKWHSRIYEIMTSISEQDFTLRFKDILEMQEFLQRGERIASVQEKITLALRDHKEQVKPELAALIDDPQYKNGDDGMKEEKKNKIIDKVENFLDKCKINPQVQQQQQSESENVEEEQPENSQQQQQQENGQDVEMPENEHPPFSQCKKCSLAFEALTNLKNDSKNKPYEPEVLTTMENHIKNIIELTRAELTTFLQYQQEDRKTNYLVQQEIIKFLKNVLSKPSNVSKVQDIEFRTTCIDQISDIVENKLKKIPLKKFKGPIFREIYDSLPPEFQDRLSRDFKKNLGQFPSSSSPLASPEFFENVRIYDSSILLGASLTAEQQTQFYNESRRIVKKVLEEKDLESYELNYGLSSTLNRKMKELLYNFQAKHGDFSDFFAAWEAALWIFLTRVYEIEEKWVKDESPANKFGIHILFYQTQIDTILHHGITPKSAGMLCGDRLRQELTQEAKLFAEKQHREFVLCRKWFASVENTRLLYFSELAKRIQSKKEKLDLNSEAQKEYDDAIREGILHFRDPSKTMETWLHKKINEFPDDQRKLDFTLYFTNEMNQVIKKIRKAKTIHEIRELEREHFRKSGLYAADIDLDLGENEMGNEGLLSFKEHALEELEYDMEHIRNSVEFETTSSDNQLRRKIGCTACCKFCGAICWGARGHTSNRDNSQFHFAPHQPQGFHNGVFDRSQELIATCCYENQDDEIHYWGNRMSRGTKWADTKLHRYFKDWLYTRHPNSTYNELMLWLLILLNDALAEENGTKVNIVKPNSQVKKLQLRDLNTILRDIETTVGVRAKE